MCFGFLKKRKSVDKVIERLNAENERLMAELEKKETRLENLKEKYEKDADAQRVADLENARWKLQCENRDLQREKQKLANENRALKEWNLELIERFKKKFPDSIFPVLDTRETDPGETFPTEVLKDALAETDRNNMLLNESIDVLGLETKTYRCLRRHGIDTVLELMSHDAAELLDNVRNFGQSCLNDLYLKMSRYDLYLCDVKPGKMTKRMRRILTPTLMRMAKIESIGLSSDECDKLHQYSCYSAYGLSLRSRSQLLAVLGNVDTVEKIGRWMNEQGFSLKD